MGLLIPAAATAAAATAGIWFLPLLVATVSYYQYDKVDPEGRPKNAKVINWKIKWGDRKPVGKNMNNENRCQIQLSIVKFLRAFVVVIVVAGNLQVLWFHCRWSRFGWSRRGQPTERSTQLERALVRGRWRRNGDVRRACLGSLFTAQWARLAVQNTTAAICLPSLQRSQVRDIHQLSTN